MEKWKERAMQMIKRQQKGFHQEGAVLRYSEEGESMEGSSVGRENMSATAVGLEGDKDPPPPVEMEMLDGKGHLGLERSLEYGMHFPISILFFEDDASKGINNLPPRSLGSVVANLGC